MPSPYGITEVDVPGLLGVYQGAQDRRYQRMLEARRMAMEDRQIEREGKMADAWDKFLTPKGGVEGAAQSYDASGAPPPAASPAQDFDPWTDEAAQNELIGSLGHIDPKQAMELRSAFSKMGKEQREAAGEAWGMIANTAFQLRQMPPDARAAEFQRLTPMLEQMGLGEYLGQVDLSDQGLETIVNQGRDIEAVIKGRTPTVESVPGVGLYPVTPGSAYPDFGNGGARASAGIGQPVTVQEGATATNPTTGQQIIFRGGQWVPATGGSGGNAAGGF